MKIAFAQDRTLTIDFLHDEEYCSVAVTEESALLRVRCNFQLATAENEP